MATQSKIKPLSPKRKRGAGPDSLHWLVGRFRAPCLLPLRKRFLWGQPHMVRPALVRERFGNGKRLIVLWPIMHRPCYYLVWVDDRWCLDNWGKPPLLCDELGEVYSGIEDEFGRRDPEDAGPYHWPDADLDDGCAWCEAVPGDVLPRRARLRLFRSANTEASDAKRSD